MNMRLLENQKILAIDDADAIRSFLRISLEANGAEFYEADTACKGVELVKEVAPNLVVLDLGLPDKDGLEILPEIKASPNAPDVIILSVRKERDIREKAKSLGADDYLSKPFMMDDLLEAILNQLH